MLKGDSDQESLYKWFRQVEHYRNVTVLDETGLIKQAWQDFAPEVANWFEAAMAQDYHFDFMPPAGEPIPVDGQ